MWWYIWCVGSYSVMVIYSLGDNRETEKRDAEKASASLKSSELPEHLQIGSTFIFRVTVQQAFNISTEYTDIFCQFK